MKIVDLSTLKTRDANDANYVQFLNELCDMLGFDYASYATSSPVSGDVQGYANYPDEWKLHYMQRGLHRIDPTLHKSALSIAPVDWNRFTKDTRFNTVFSDAHDFGITTRGLTIPIRGPYGDCGLLNVTRKCTDAEWDNQIRHVTGELQVAAVHIHDRVMHSGILNHILATPQLSLREIEILQWVAVGKSQQDVGDILTISHRTVEVHLRSSRDKLGALTTAQAVGRAIGLGLIHPG